MDITRKKSLIAPLTYLKATIDLGSYTKAAEYLGTTESRLSKEIKAFEKTMKTKLLSRCSRGMTPTHEGMEIYKQAERLDTLFYELENYSLAEHSISGHLKISMTDGIGIYIMPHLVEFHELYAKVCVDVISNHNEVNLKARKADIAIVYQYPQKDNSLVVKEYKREFGLFASIPYIKKYGMPKNIDDLLAKYDLCNRREYNENWEEWRQMMAEAKKPVAHFDSSNLLIQATDFGLAASLQPLQYGLQRENWVYLDLGLRLHHSCWVVSHYDDRNTEKIKKMLDFIHHVMVKI